MTERPNSLKSRTRAKVALYRTTNTAMPQSNQRPRVKGNAVGKRGKGELIQKDTKTKRDVLLKNVKKEWG